jgi:hypothetical protein
VRNASLAAVTRRGTRTHHRHVRSIAVLAMHTIRTRRIERQWNGMLLHSTHRFVLAALLLVGCGTVYRDTWQPMTAQDVFPRVLHRAPALEPLEVEMVQRAGGKLIGYHATTEKYALRAASVGGTHWIAVAGNNTSRTHCVYGFCSTSSGYRPRKIAVFRVEPAQWDKLPPHLIPPTNDVEDGIHVYVTRDGCSVDRSWGRVSCSNSWQVRRHASSAAPPAAAAHSSGSSTPAAL